MGNRKTILLSIFVVLLISVPVHAEISLFFDQNGNIISSPSKKSSEVATRHLVPEGVELPKGVNYEFYPVFGKTFSEIVRSAEENGPFDRSLKRRFTSRHEWAIGWSFQYEDSYEIDEEENTVRASVEIFDVEVRDIISMTLPTLIDDTALNQAEKNLWKNYFLRLLEYENGFLRIIRDPDSRNELIKSLKDINYFVFDYSSVPEAEKTVETSIREEDMKIGRAWVKQIRARCDDYERATEHGSKYEAIESFFKQRSPE